MAPHSSTLAWKIPWMEEPSRLQSMGSLRVGHGWATSLSLFTFMHWRRQWQPTPVFLPGESQEWGAWWAAIYGVTQSRTRLKWLSSSSKERLKPFSFQVHLQIFSPVGCLFVLFMVSFAVQKLLSLIRSYLFISAFIFITLGGGAKKILLQFMSKSVLPVFL